MSTVKKSLDMVSEDGHFSEVEVHLVRPGDDIRIINVLDVVEPRHKVSGPGGMFPGLLGPAVGVGSGRTDRLTNPVVALCSEPMTDEPVYWRDSIMDMTGPAARYNLFRDNHVLVLALKPRLLDETADRGASALTNHAYGAGHVQDYNHAARMAGLRVAEYLSCCARGTTADSVDVYELGDARPGLPKVYFACQLVLHRVYGELLGWQPTLLHPNEFFDGAVFNPYNPPACGRETTYWLQNHPVVRAAVRTAQPGNRLRRCPPSAGAGYEPGRQGPHYGLLCEAAGHVEERMGLCSPGRVPGTLASIP